MLSGNFAEMTTSTPFRDLLHAAKLRHGTDGFTSPPKEEKNSGGTLKPLEVRGVMRQRRISKKTLL